MPEERLHLPEANEFSPGQISLSFVLKTIQEHTGNKAAILEAFRSTYFSQSALQHKDESKRLKIQLTRAYNILVGMKAYGLLDSTTHSLTAIGRSLIQEKDRKST